MVKYLMELFLVDYVCIVFLFFEIVVVFLYIVMKVVDELEWIFIMEYYSMYFESKL